MPLRPLIHRFVRAWRKSWPWVVLVLLVLVLQVALVALVLNYENNRLNEHSEKVARQAAMHVRQSLTRSARSLQALPVGGVNAYKEAALALRGTAGLLRVELRDAGLTLLEMVDLGGEPVLFSTLGRDTQFSAAQAACSAAGSSGAPVFSRSYFTPLPQGLGMEVMDLCISTSDDRFIVATFSLPALLEHAVAAAGDAVHEYSFVESDGARLARAGVARGRGVYRNEQIVDVLGAGLVLQANSGEGQPALIPNLSVALVVGLSTALLATLGLLARDIKHRSAAERELAQALAFRRAMEDSLVTGLRARDLQGRITYVNPAFCKMVGMDASRLLGTIEPPYWPPEHAPAYRERHAQRLAGDDRASAGVGHESVFMRNGGERFPVLIYEARLMEPSVEGKPRHTGWMSAVLDLSEQRRTEERARQQQERLQATARLATMGEMASLLSHELNQPLAAIASYAHGSLNLLAHNDVEPTMLQPALERIAEQADRAGRTIKSVHDFVRRREQSREAVSALVLLHAVLPLAQLQAHRSGARIELQAPPTEPPAKVLADRTMVEQVLLNLTRNGLQAMEGDDTAVVERVLTLSVAAPSEGKVAFTVRDQGPGIAPEVAVRLFTPFFTTRSDGMGLGLSLCRTVIEQHGGHLSWHAVSPRGTAFVFTLPAAPSPHTE